MPIKVTVPKIGTSMAPLALVEWQAKEGDWVDKGSVLLIVESEKIRHDVEAKASGFLHILVKAGTESPVGSSAGLIVDTEEELKTLQKETPAGTPEATTQFEEDTTRAEAAEPATKQEKGERIRISPAARRMAEERMIDISKIVGTGPGGAIRRNDVEKAIEAEKPKTATESGAEEYQGKRLKESIRLIGMRKAIAEHMHRSVSVSANVYLMGEIDMLEMVKLRESLLERAESL